MTELGEGTGPAPRRTRCGWCGRVLLQPTGRGRPRAYCQHACRQQAYLARRLAAAAGAAGGLVVDRASLDALLDRRYELELAVADLRRITDDGDDPTEALGWLLEHIERLLEVRLLAGQAEAGTT